MNSFRVRSKEQLASLAREASDTKAKLQARLRLAETILSQAEHVSRLETHRERAFPFADAAELATSVEAIEDAAVDGGVTSRASTAATAVLGASDQTNENMRICVTFD